MEIPEEEDENTEITGVDQNTEDSGVNHTTGANNAMHGNPPGPIPTNYNNKPKMETVDDEYDTEEGKTENEETIQDEKEFEFQVNSPSHAERRAWEAPRKYGLRPRQNPSFKNKYPSNHYENLMVHVLTQLNLKQGLQRFENEGIKATKSEMQQIHDKVVFHLIKGKQLNRIQKHGVLGVLIFLKQKRCWKIKALPLQMDKNKDQDQRNRTYRKALVAVINISNSTALSTDQ